MKILLTAIGTRGDVEPFLAIAELLDQKGHDVICCFPEQFRKITMDSDFKFVGLTSKFLEMMESKEGKIAMGGKANFLAKIRAYYVLYKRAKVINKIFCKEQHDLIKIENPDKIIYHIKASYPLIHEALYPGKTILVSPIPYMVHPVNEHAHIGFKSLGKFWNKLTYKLANWGLLKNVQSGTKGLYDRKLVTSKKILAILPTTKTIYTISPFLFKQPSYWNNNVKILGYHERNKMLNWKPSDSLLEFIKDNKHILFITFGSMVNENPEKKTQFIVNVLEKLKIPTLINTGEGGLMEVENYDKELIHFVSNIPYDWLLPQVTNMIHHGGSGTTHMAMKYGCPSLIIPHIIDQFLWNELNSSLGIGPKGVSISTLNERNFESLLRELMNNPSFKEKASEASQQINNENLQSELYEFITS